VAARAGGRGALGASSLKRRAGRGFSARLSVIAASRAALAALLLARCSTVCFGALNPARAGLCDGDLISPSASTAVVLAGIFRVGRGMAASFRFDRRLVYARSCRLKDESCSKAGCTFDFYGGDVLLATLRMDYARIADREIL
jgi:hypothetical protein